MRCPPTTTTEISMPSVCVYFFGFSHVGKSHKSCVLRDATVAAIKLPCSVQVRKTIFAIYDIRYIRYSPPYDIRYLRYSPFTILVKKTNLEGAYRICFDSTPIDTAFVLTNNLEYYIVLYRIFLDPN